VIERRLPRDRAVDLARSLKPISAGRHDPTLRLRADALLHATHTPEGPATLGIEPAGEDGWVARAWGTGAAWVLARAERWVGTGDAVPVGFLEAHPELETFAKRARGVRLVRPGRIVEHLTLLVLQQLVTGKESKRAFGRLVREFSEPAPGPFPGLWLPLHPERLRAIPSAAFIPLGIVPRMGETLHRVGTFAARLEAAGGMALADACARLRAVRGIGPWTAASVALGSLGHPDAVVVGDYHLPNTIAYHLAGEARADDARMLDLLAPYTGQRGRVQRWVSVAGGKAPRFGPRLALRDLPDDADRWLRRRTRRGE